MNAQESANRLQSISRALQGLIFGIFMVFAALVSLDINGIYVGFALLPVLTIYFWPLEASHSWSLICIFILGFFHDVVSNGPFGVWTLSYLILFIVLDGGVSIKHGFRNNFGGFVLTLAFAVLLAYVFGTFALGRSPGVKSLLISALTAILVFPFVYWIRSVLGVNHATGFSSGGGDMRGRNENTIDSGRRAMVLGIGGLGVFGVLASRLYYLQVTQAENYKVLSDKNRFNFNMIIPERGRILDRFGEPIATNKQDFRLVMVPERVKNIDQTLNRIATILPLSDRTRRRIKKDVREHAKFVPILVGEHLDWKVFSALNMKLPEIPGVTPLEDKGRDYPYKGTFSHILGYVGKPNPKALEGDTDPLLRQPTFRMGKTGIEQSQDKALRGVSGRQKVEVNAVGRTVREWEDDKIAAKSGQDIWLTIDAGLQAFAAEQLGEQSGGVAVIDVMTGELRVLLSMPTFDGNLFVSGLTSADMAALNADPRRPQFNKVIGGGAIHQPPRLKCQ